MILRLVDRRTDAPAEAADWFRAPDRMDMVSGLAAGLGCPDWTVDLVLVDDRTMADLNSGYRGTEGVTDVLSFSYLEDAGNGDPALEAGAAGAVGDLWLENVSSDTEGGMDTVVGEIVLAPSFIEQRCLEKGWPLAGEMPMLVVHGMLHILGWDHADEPETEAMQLVEQEILAAAGLPHPLRERG